MIKGWLSRQRNGSYTLTGLKPTVTNVGRTNEQDIYIRPGDPLGYRHMCEESVKLIWKISLEPLEVRRVWMDGGSI